MFALRYLKEHLKLVGVELLFVCIFGIVFFLYHLPLAAVLYPAGICALLGCFFAAFSMYRAYRKHRRLEELLTGHRAAIEEAFAENGDIAEEDYRRVALKLCGEMQALEERASDSYQEMVDYFTIWVHQIKTPIASMRLSLKEEDSKLSRKLASDLLHIEQYVEMVLTYIRMGSESTDYVFGEVSLDRIVREGIRKLRGDFILKKLNLEYEPFTETVVSDEKWLAFVVEQILSNALKYTNEGTVSICLEEPKTLCVRDTGIGIAPEELSRVFEKGYTGSNGRADKRASGLGLYLSRQICERLGVKLSIDSEAEVGTTVRMDLSGQAPNRVYR